MKLSTWAKKQGISYQTAWRWWKSGRLPVPAKQMPTGTVIVDEPIIQQTTQNIKEKVYVYCRVSSVYKKDDLTRQAQRCAEFCESHNFEIVKTYKEIASGMNDNRKLLQRLFDDNPTKIVVEHKDRLTRFGFNYIETLLKKVNCSIVVIDRDKEEQDDLMKDLIAIITSFCCRLYGMRRGRKKALNIKTELNKTDDTNI